jgi:hypothetical protein
MHTTSCASERNWYIWGHIYSKTRSRLAIERAEKLVFIKQNYAAASAHNVLPNSDADWEICLNLLSDEKISDE